VFTSEEGASAVDPKNLMVYVKVIDHIASIYKMEYQRSARP